MSVISRRAALGIMTALALPRIVSAAPANVIRGASSLRLMMVTERTCEFCRAWRTQIAPGFAASGPGRMAPLFEVDLYGPYPDGLALARRPRLTPSFILLDDGFEIGRIEGYVGQRDFYPHLERMMAQAGVNPSRREG